MDIALSINIYIFACIFQVLKYSNTIRKCQFQNEQNIKILDSAPSNHIDQKQPFGYHFTSFLLLGIQCAKNTLQILVP